MYVLASASPRRKDILEKANVEFEIVTSNYIERDLGIKNPYLLAEELAFGKASEVAKDIQIESLSEPTQSLLWKEKLLENLRILMMPLIY